MPSDTGDDDVHSEEQEEEAVLLLCSKRQERVKKKKNPECKRIERSFMAEDVEEVKRSI